MKKIIVIVLGLAMMSSSVAFAADPISHSKLSAFQNVKTTAVSTDEMNKVSGSGKIQRIVVKVGKAAGKVAGTAAGILGFGVIGSVANKLTCGTWGVCKAS